MKTLFDFFISCPLSFEEHLAKEIQECSPYLLDESGRTGSESFLQPVAVAGGVELETTLIQGLQLNFFLKIANRILLRLGHFKAYEFSVLESKFLQLKKIDLIKDYNVSFQVSAEKSKLNNESRIKDCLEKLMPRLQKKKSMVNAPKLTVYVRVVEDHFTISIDTTGEHLHKRGLTPFKGEAPLRETTAALLLKLMMADETPATLNEVTIFDPMMGAGTFLTEAMTLWWPSFSRAYDFQMWKWVPSVLSLPLLSKNYQLLPAAPFGGYKGSDLSEKAIKNATSNFEHLKEHLARQLKLPGIPSVQVFQSNVLSLRPTEASPKGKVWIIVNPPYGERLEDSEGVLTEKLIPHLIEQWSPQKIGLLLPQKSLNIVQKGTSLKPQSWRINNGGLETQFLLYDV